MNAAAKASFARARLALHKARIWREKANLLDHLVSLGFTELVGTPVSMREAERMYVQIALSLRAAAKMEMEYERSRSEVALFIGS